ncbi:MAG: hypothetical protein AB8H86_26155 [Polyangiales bacterium]
MKNTLLLALLAALGAPGCYLDLSGEPTPPNRPGPRVTLDGGVDAAEPDAGWGDSGPWEARPGENTLAVSAVALDGQVGPVASDASSEFYVNESFESFNSATFDLRSRHTSGFLMNLVSIENHQLLEVGETYESGRTPAGASVFVSVLGCSGAEENLWTADSPSEEVTLFVREGAEEGSAELFYTARFLNGDTVEGSFVMPLSSL